MNSDAKSKENGDDYLEKNMGRICFHVSSHNLFKKNTVTEK